MHLLVGNPTAQSGKNAQRIALARQILDRLGVAHEFLATLPAGHTPSAVASRLRSDPRIKTVIAMGGDGTFKEVASGLLDSGAAARLAMLPTGTANDQGKSFGLSSAPEALERNARVIAAGYAAPFDAVRITAFDHLDRPLRADWFFDSAGWGFSPWVLRLRNTDRAFIGQLPIVRDIYRDQLVYVGAALRAFLATYVEDHYFEAQVELADGSRHQLTDLTDLVIKNTLYYGGAWIFDGTASPEDGEVELIPLRGRREWIQRLVMNQEALPIPLPQEELKDLGLIQLSPILRSSRMHVRLVERPGSPALEGQLDGEEWVAGISFDVRVHRHAIRLVVPEPG